MTPTPFPLIPAGSRYVMDADDHCYLISDAVAAGGEVRGSAYFPPGETVGTQVYTRVLTPHEKYIGARSVPKTVADFDSSDWR